ncbi:MAG TPA: tRNA epoxyqueuosine(34) reductase QueG [Candidatus Omnitrophota bacterium]|nr:tRNA epoxyqueuosine(34) reductase QueG [Candidatus Omnitrophota bacterium]
MSAELSAEIKRFAKDAGFDLAGITPFRPLKEAEGRLKRWTAKGYHGGMRYLENFDSRWERLRAKIPDAGSMIVLGVNYFSETGRPERIKSSLRGKIAKYARGRDYHEVIREKLKGLEKFLKGKDSRAQCFVCVDTEPLFERAYAEEAGFGFCGKHTNLLTKRFGPWVFLAEVITNLDLYPDPAGPAGSCGRCRKCLDACPTKALTAPYQMDARRCIAYLTIEHKGVIPEELRPLIKDRVFGCDECLKACPFSKFAKETSWPEFESQKGSGPFLDLRSLFEIKSNRAYERKFRGTPLVRASRKMMLRNAAIALGNFGSAETVPTLRQALEREDALVKIHVAWALNQIKARNKRPAGPE